MIPENKVKFKILKSGWGLDNEVELFWTGWVANTTLLSLWLKSKDTIRGQSKFIGGKKTQLVQKLFYYYYYQALLPACSGKQKKKTTLLGINTVHLLYYPF